MFSDEATFTQFQSKSCRVRRPPNQRFNARYVTPTVKKSPTVMVWASFSAAGRGGIWFMPRNTMINGQVYLSILQEKLPHHMGILNCTTFQHDGAPCHQTRAVSSWLRDSGIEVLGPWPGSSPDLNPIENMWTLIKQKVAEQAPTSEKDLIEVIKRVWVTEVSQQYCENLVTSMPRRIEAVLKSRGQYTKY